MFSQVGTSNMITQPFSPTNGDTAAMNEREERKLGIFSERSEVYEESEEDMESDYLSGESPRSPDKKITFIV